jgi:hypothetical protein
VAQFKAYKPATLSIPMTNGRFNPSGAATNVDRWSIGALKGWEMALEDACTRGFHDFWVGCYVTVECVEIQPSTQEGQSDMPKFTVSIADQAPDYKPPVMPGAEAQKK